MAIKVHLHLHASDLEKSRDFYRRFFGDNPVKEKPGYVKFLPAWAPVNLALSTGGPTGVGTVDHVGVQVDSPATVLEHLERVKASGIPVREEIGVDCCHANQDKFWVQDPDGVEWEVYYLNFDLEEETPRAGVTMLPMAKEASCCAPTCCATS
jgi:catechol 2,3-dioxygenase-like lactoylglutathione lyase family enzyme